MERLQRDVQHRRGADAQLQVAADRAADAGGLRDPEVRQLHVAFPRDEDVVGRHVAVDDAERRAVGRGALVDVRERDGQTEADVVKKFKSELPAFRARLMTEPCVGL